MSHVVAHLAEYAAGTLEPARAREVEAHLRECPHCARELAALDDALAALPLDLPPAPATAALRERLLASAARDPAGRFESLVARVATMIDLAADKARELLVKIDDAASWVPGPGTSRLIHLPYGPALAADSNVGFVRLAAGKVFPEHVHLGDEHVLVLQGGLEDSGGDRLVRGMEARMPAGSSHTFRALPGADLVYLVVLRAGIEIPGQPDFQL
jgi:anti-sigma factor ChrR (cupin superfamily)